MFDNKWQKKEMPLVSLIGMGGGIASPAFLASIVLNILKPTVFSPVDDTGVPDFDYTAESSAITNTSSLTTLDDFTSITSRTGQYEYIESDQNGSVFVTADVSSSNYFEISTDGGATWSNSNTVSSWAALRAHCFVDSPTYKGFIFGSVLSGMGGDAPTYKSSQGNYLSWSQAGTIPSYQSDRGRYDAFATDNNGFIVAAGAYSNVAYSTDNADSWTRVSPGSGGTNTSLPHWTTCTYFAKLGKFVIGGNNQSSAGNKVYLSGDTSQVQSGNWTIHDSASNPPGFDDMACNDDYLFAVSFSSSSVWRTSDLTSWTQIADFSGTDISPYTIKVKGSIILLSDFSTTGNTGDVIASADGGANWIYKKINSGDTFGSFDAAIDKDNNIVAVNDRKSPRVARTTLNATTTLTLTDTTVSKISDGSLIDGTSIDQVLTVGETVQADTAVTSTITAPVFNTTLYTGNVVDGNTENLVQTGIDNTGKSLVWLKPRDLNVNHQLWDTLRIGSGGSPSPLYSDVLDKQTDNTGGNGLVEFKNNGFLLKGGWGGENTPGERQVAWNFRAAPGFFDIVTYQATRNAMTIPHSLGAEPGCIICKDIDATNAWYVYHKELGFTKAIYLNSNNPAFDITTGVTATSANDFTIGDHGSLNNSPSNYVAYLFADDTPGLIKCGGYSATGTNNTQSINFGFRPGWFMVKMTSNNENYLSAWIVVDSERGTTKRLLADTTQAEFDQSGIVFTDTGIDVTGWSNRDGWEYVYVAIAENSDADITTQSTASGEVSASSGNTITLSNTTGTWSTGMKVQGVTTDTKDNPDPIKVENVSLTSSAPTAERNVSTWGDAMWEIATDENFTQNVQTATTALSATGTQAGPSFTLEPDTGYYTRTKYTALGQESEWSDVTYFVTKSIPVYADDVFSTYLYTGTGGTITVDNGIDLSGEGGLVWTKSRNNTDNGYGDTFHKFTDTEVQKILYTNSTAAGTLPGYQRTFNSNGFTDSYGWSSGNEIASWTFRKAPGFFDIVTYSGNGSTQTISHNLGSVPGMIIVKRTDSTRDWAVYHRSLGNNQALKLNDTSAARGFAGWGYTTPTSNAFYLGVDSDVNNSSGTYVAYIFAHDDQSFGTNGDESIIKCDSYIGESAWATPLEINLGFEPQFVLIKDTNSTRDWVILDAMRGWTGSQEGTSSSAWLTANTNNPESEGTFGYLTPTGFVVKNSSFVNGNNNKFIYMAIRRPHKPVTSSSEVFAVNTWGGTTPNPPALGAGFPVDLVFHKMINASTAQWEWSSRLTATKVLNSNNTNPESTDSQFKFDYQTGAHDSGSSFSNHYSWLFRRSPGFMDVVTYTGNGSSGHTISHNLSVEPELMIVKNRDDYYNWRTYDSANGATNYMFLNSTSGSAAHPSVWNNTAPTDTQFTLGNSVETNKSGDNFIAYLFATLPGISKVGSYVGNGPNGAQQVDCGFTNGAAFILVKNASSSGDWYLLDSERGINAYNETEPYLTLNNKNSEQTANILGYHNVGFMVSGQYGSASLNNAGETYIFFAIANP